MVNAIVTLKGYEVSTPFFTVYCKIFVIFKSSDTDVSTVSEPVPIYFGKGHLTHFYVLKISSVFFEIFFYEIS